MSKTRIVTIGRQFSAGGPTIGKELARQLGVGFYARN